MFFPPGRYVQTHNKGKYLDRYVCCDEKFVLVVVLGGFEANGVDEISKSLDDPLVELVELRRIED